MFTGPEPLLNKSLIIYAPNHDAAQQSLNTLLGAMSPGTPPLLPGSVGWREAPKEQQPDGPVRPGIRE